MTYIQFFTTNLNKSRRNRVIFKYLFYFLNILSFILIFIGAMISVFHLAIQAPINFFSDKIGKIKEINELLSSVEFDSDKIGNINALLELLQNKGNVVIKPEEIELINQLIGLKKISNSISVLGAGTNSFPIITTLLSTVSSAIVGLISFFYVKEKYKKAIVRYDKLTYEKVKYNLNIGQYKVDKKDLVLYEETIKIMNYINVEAMRVYDEPRKQ